MSPAEISARATATFAIEFARSAELQKLARLVGRDAVYVAWIDGYLSGEAAAYEHAAQMKRGAA